MLQIHINHLRVIQNQRTYIATGHTANIFSQTSIYSLILQSIHLTLAVTKSGNHLNLT